MRRRAILATAVTVMTILAFAGTARAVEVTFARHPAPSPDGSVIAFSWRGDLWTVPSAGGEARRLTAHPAADRFPVWSRDGRWIAFASARHGNLDVYVVPADGSEAPRRLTFASVDDVPVDFVPDGQAVLFVSRRDESIRWMPAMYTVPVGGGTPRLAEDVLGRWAAYSPSGDALAFVRGSTKWWRRGYRGAANREIWLRTGDGEVVRVTAFDGDDDCPSWLDDHDIVFLSARSGRKNVFMKNLVTDEVTQLTRHDGSDVRFSRASADGSLVAYEFETGLWTVRPGSEPVRLRIEAPADEAFTPVERRVDRSGADELAVSPDGALAAFVVHGEVFVTAVRPKDEQEIAPPPTVRITRTAAREKDIAWSPDGKALLFTSDRSGNDDLYLARPADPEAGWLESFDFPATRLTSSEAEEHAGRFAPDGKRIAYLRGKGDLVIVDADGSDPVTLVEHWAPPEFDWSPDGRWIAYAIPDMEYNNEVWLVPVDGSAPPYNVSRHPDDDLQPRFSPDGRRLVWISRRHADTFDVWGVWLTREDDERTPEGWLKLFAASKKSGKKKTGKKPEDAGKEQDEGEGSAEGGAKALPEVRIDFEGLWERVRPLTDLKGDEDSPRVSPDGKRVVFTAERNGERDLYSVRYDGKDLKRLTEGGQDPSAVSFGPDGKELFYLDGDGRVKRVSLSGKAGDPVPFTARYEIDRTAERNQVFTEAWRALNEWFYDPQFHGVDWKAQLPKYRPWAYPGIGDEDFADLVNLMLGELDASHMGYYPHRGGGSHGPRGERTGWIGALFDPAAGGPGVLVREVLRHSPAARVDVALEPGERILAVAGTPVGPDTNVYALLADTAGQRVPLRIRGKDGAERTAVVIPVSGREERQLRYGQWVWERERMVERLSGGRLGYIHIQGMDIPSFEEFERQLYAAAHGKEGLVIDVRSNGGGWTTDYLMAVLEVKRHAYTIPRDGDPKVRAYPQGRLPLAAWTRPAITLCNEESYSNAEIFSWAFRTLGRGTLAGTQTFGAVISTDGRMLLDGALVRLPMRGWYVAGSGINMERHGAEPDLVIDQPPTDDLAADHDTQLERAVAAFLANIGNDPRFGAW